MKAFDTIFKHCITDAFKNKVYGIDNTPPAQTVQPKLLLAHWDTETPGTIDIDNTLGFPVIKAWRDKLGGYEFTPPTLTQAPLWVTETNMASHRPGISFDGLDDWMDCTNICEKMTNLEGLTVSMLLRTYETPINQIERVIYLEAASGVPRFGYARSGLGAGEFYFDGVARDADPIIPVIGGTYDYDGWATHTYRRNFIAGTGRVDYNNGLKMNAGSMESLAYSDATTPSFLRLGAEHNGVAPGQFYIYGIKLYTYYITDAETIADGVYFGGLINA